MPEFELTGLNARQQMLADIMWQMEEYTQVEAFIATLPDREACECQAIIEMMKMALVEQCYDGVQKLDEAKKLIDKIRK